MTTTNLTDHIIELEQDHLVQTYKRPPFVLAHGEGVYLYDTTGKKYLDMVAGIAVNALAGAGTGKTRTLVQRVVRELFDPVDEEEHLHLQRLLAPEGAVVVEGGDALVDVRSARSTWFRALRHSRLHRFHRLSRNARAAA